MKDNILKALAIVAILCTMAGCNINKVENQNKESEKYYSESPNGVVSYTNGSFKIDYYFENKKEGKFYNAIITNISDSTISIKSIDVVIYVNSREEPYVIPSLQNTEFAPNETKQIKFTADFLDDFKTVTHEIMYQNLD